MRKENCTHHLNYQSITSIFKIICIFIFAFFYRFYYQKLQTQNHFDIKSLAEKTNTNIIIPEIGQEGKLKIVGDNEENLQVALNEIHAAIGFIRDKNVALQFSTIPLLSKEIQSNFEKFKVSMVFIICGFYEYYTNLQIVFCI